MPFSLQLLVDHRVLKHFPISQLVQNIQVLKQAIMFMAIQFGCVSFPTQNTTVQLQFNFQFKHEQFIYPIRTIQKMQLSLFTIQHLQGNTSYKQELEFQKLVTFGNDQFLHNLLKLNKDKLIQKQINYQRKAWFITLLGFFPINFKYQQVQKGEENTYLRTRVYLCRYPKTIKHDTRATYCNIFQSIIFPINYQNKNLYSLRQSIS
eukprot:TRINITY_DN3730_c2_g1_i1.p2 TRINITY_DN3730_c2_g1~~TRINITY_DN3730_c2_g1_i1.p2  ORF type:complete len:206 (-),score=-16.10 TRINITY_DN3730_c2_g1_i1:122-739(-)